VDAWQGLDLQCEKTRFHKWIIDHPITQNKENTIYDKHGSEVSRELEKSLERVNAHKEYQNLKPKMLRNDVVRGLLHNAGKRDILARLGSEMDEVLFADNFVTNKKLEASAAGKDPLTDCYFYRNAANTTQSDAVVETGLDSRKSSEFRKFWDSRHRPNPKTYTDKNHPESRSREPKSREYTPLKDKYKGFLGTKRGKTLTALSSCADSFERYGKKNTILVQNQSSDFETEGTDPWDQSGQRRRTGEVCRTDASEEKHRTFPGGHPKNPFSIETADISIGNDASFMNYPSQEWLYAEFRNKKQPSMNPGRETIEKCIRNKTDQKSHLQTAAGTQNSFRDQFDCTPEITHIKTFPIF
jgi:hypothetical protein